MPSHDAPTPDALPSPKRQRQSDPDRPPSPHDSLPSPSTRQPTELGIVGCGGKVGQSSNFRNVSACNRCRLRKNRCDQKLPSCASCIKAGVACVGYDPITKKQIPRSYVFYLETRVEQLEKLLASHDIPFPPSDNLELCSRPSVNAVESLDDTGSSQYALPDDDVALCAAKPHSRGSDSAKVKKAEQSPAMLNIISPARPRSLASASGVSFARVVYAAVQYTVSDQGGATERPHRNASAAGTSMRDSFFGLHTKPTIQPAPFPDKDVGLRLVTLYFEHANPQIPILHRGEFMHVFEHAYSNPDNSLTARELYLLNMVFAIGSGVIVGEPVKTEASEDAKLPTHRAKDQRRPEEYHASAIVHLESCLSFSGGGLEVLQAVLLLANFALLRPVPPGLWYITGVALRLAVDLGLHHEEAGDPESSATSRSSEKAALQSDGRDGAARERGRRLWMRDMRRRLWWCTYSFDRLVSTCVGRPFGISDQVITTELPSLLDDTHITKTGFVETVEGEQYPSYKHVAHHYFRLRMLQSEILQVLQYNQAHMARSNGDPTTQYPEMHSGLPSPFLVPFDSFRTWRMDIDRRLYEWRVSAPTRLDTGVAFSTEFLELNYWQAIVMLYRQSLSVPVMFEGEYNTSDEVNSPTAYTTELREDQDHIYFKVAEAGQKIVRIYRQLHLSGLVSYTYLSTHHLFMAGISYLYAIWHSPAVRGSLSMEEVDFTTLAAKSVFTDMMDKCPPAETCRDAFDRTAKATIKMASSNGGFGPQASLPRRRGHETTGWGRGPDAGPSMQQFSSRGKHRQPEQSPYRFDVPMPDNLSSPGLSVAGERHTPPLGRRNTYDADTVMARPRSHGGSLPSERAMSQERTPSMDRLLATSPTMLRPPEQQQQQAGSSSSAFMSQPFDAQGSADFPDTPSLEFLHGLGAAPNGGVGGGGADQAQLDLGFGIGWEGTYNDYGEGQQMNPFDTFFFGGGIGGSGNGAGIGSGPPSSNGSSGGGINM